MYVLLVLLNCFWMYWVVVVNSSRCTANDCTILVFSSDAELDLTKKESNIHVTSTAGVAKKRLNTDGVVVKEISSSSKGSVIVPPAALTSQAACAVAARKTAVARSLLTSNQSAAPKLPSRDAAIHDSPSRALSSIPKDSLEEIFKHMDLAGQMCDEIMGLSGWDGGSQVCSSKLVPANI